VPAETDLLYKAIQGRQAHFRLWRLRRDGLTARHLLETLRRSARPPYFYVPHGWRKARPQCRRTAEIAQSGAAVVVTVDCGICSVAEADEARRLGLS